ncbi:CPBP family intramembrane glutamic endopeptidase [Pedobacter sp. JY14-1]|uniref:CPBP family intramembrane glutamic endopeptidase n=1 Tax=Pedobacter sp. JY14-1 TaxID=3034151 RepID=UPI0023E0E283|nr:CPBP family intramembrane glutamic endopeptidase [Pedobacter sp. JY14-1]
MNFILKPREEDSPYGQVAYIAGLALAGLLIFSVIAILVIVAMYGIQILGNPAALSGAEPRYIPALQLLVIASSLGLFLFPALVLPLTQRRRISDFYWLSVPSGQLFFLVFLVMIVSLPFMEWVTLSNQQMSFPSFLKSIEDWMREKEDEALRTTILLLKMNGVKDLLLNLFIVALLPAVAEELMFRGALQRTLGRLFGNHHVAIWIAAIVFSAIHLQFYGFIPRLLLGAGFGYLYFWGRSIWYAVLGHFLNNAYAVTIAWYMQQNHITDWAKADSEPHFGMLGYALSFVLLIFAIAFFRRQALNTKKTTDKAI